MYFVYRDGTYIDCAGQSFRDFMDGKLPARPGEKPTMTDWANHLTTLFPDIRLKKIIEMRGADAGSQAMLNALPAIWVGLLYDAAGCDAAWDIAKTWSASTRQALHKDVLRGGLHATVGKRTVAEIANEMLMIAQSALQKRGMDEARYLEPLLEIADAKQNRADALLAEFGAGKFDAAEVFKACRLLPESSPDSR